MGLLRRLTGLWPSFWSEPLVPGALGPGLLWSCERRRTLRVRPPGRTGGKPVRARKVSGPWCRPLISPSASHGLSDLPLGF